MNEISSKFIYECTKDINDNLNGVHFKYCDNVFPKIDEKDNDSYTYSNGYYVNCTSFFIDLRNSTNLTNRINSHTLSKFYRAYISQILHILHSFDSLRSTNIVGDCISGIFASDKRYDYEWTEGNKGDPKHIIDALHVAAMSYSMMDWLNTKFEQKSQNFQKIYAGIGINSGKTLVFKAGLKGSGDSKMIFLGDNVNIASHLCNNANKNGLPVILVTDIIYNNCENTIANSYYNTTFHDFLNKFNSDNMKITIYGGNFWNVELEQEAIQ